METTGDCYICVSMEIFFRELLLFLIKRNESWLVMSSSLLQIEEPARSLASSLFSLSLSLSVLADRFFLGCGWCRFGSWCLQYEDEEALVAGCSLCFLRAVVFSSVFFFGRRGGVGLFSGELFRKRSIVWVVSVTSLYPWLFPWKKLWQLSLPSL
jgi:hypothetical protein